MELRLGERLRQLRLERNLKQEEVAQHLGISFQSISKWERGEGYPDISLIPSLAYYYGVSTDYLLCMDELAEGKRLADLNAEWERNRANGKHQDNVELMRKALKEFPNNPLFLVQLSASLERLPGSEEERREYLHESIMVQERIINYCADSEVRGATLFNIADAYYRYGNIEKALEYANKLPNLYKARENALVRLLQDNNEKRTIAQSALEPLMWSMELHLKTLFEVTNDAAYLKRLDEIKKIVAEIPGRTA